MLNTSVPVCFYQCLVVCVWWADLAWAMHWGCARIWLVQAYYVMVWNLHKNKCTGYLSHHSTVNVKAHKVDAGLAYAKQVWLFFFILQVWWNAFLKQSVNYTYTQLYVAIHTLFVSMNGTRWVQGMWIRLSNCFHMLWTWCTVCLYCSPVLVW